VLFPPPVERGGAHAELARCSRTSCSCSAEGGRRNARTLPSHARRVNPPLIGVDGRRLREPSHASRCQYVSGCPVFYSIYLPYRPGGKDVAGSSSDHRRSTGELIRRLKDVKLPAWRIPGHSSALRVRRHHYVPCMHRCPELHHRSNSPRPTLPADAAPDAAHNQRTMSFRDGSQARGFPPLHEPFLSFGGRLEMITDSIGLMITE
jgi:hypothetical protein